MNIEQLAYSLLRFNFHYQNLNQELRCLGEFLAAHRVQANSMIDIGCGDGAITARLQRLLHTNIAYGIDVNGALLARANRRGIITWQGDAVSMEMRKKFDIVISYGSLHHFKNISSLINAMKRMAIQYLLIVDNTIRRNFWFHQLTGSPRSLIDSSPYGIHTVDEVTDALQWCDCRVKGVFTSLNANIWHDRSFFLAEV